jgi:hypothetical protein
MSVDSPAPKIPDFTAAASKILMSVMSADAESATLFRNLKVFITRVFNSFLSMNGRRSGSEKAVCRRITLPHWLQCD